jgi:deoxyribodipyrimidine photo-lyase
MITEAEVLDAVTRRHAPAAADKFIQEVCWRTYWKGWLEHRPEVWQSYCRAVETIEAPPGYAAAVEGRTGIDCFDAWARELVETGYLHNHARMWFASIWVFTLNLPWQLGAAWFLRHLLDGDPASNTLSWRWVAGLQTVGKTYLARADNIERYTNGRFRPAGLALAAPPLPAEPPVAVRPLPIDRPLPAAPFALVVTEEDLAPEVIGARIAVLDRPVDRGAAPLVSRFIAAALDDAAMRLHASGQSVERVAIGDLAHWAGGLPIVSAYAPVGPVRSALGSSGIQWQRRAWDTAAWPHAKRGFFQFRDQISQWLRAAGIGSREPSLFDV